MSAISDATTLDTGLLTIATRAADENVLFSSYGREEKRRKWDQLIDYRLLEWAQNPGEEDEESTPPSQVVIGLAIKFARILRDEKKKIPPPDWVICDGAGGVCFRWGNPREWMFSAEFRPDGTAEMIASHGTEIESRITVPAFRAR